MGASATGTFEIDMVPVDHDQAGIGRMTFTKNWSGDLAATGEGTMLSAGRPAEGRAGYVAVETLTGTLDEREGSLAFQQSGTMFDGESWQEYVVVPGSGTGAWEGISGRLTLSVDDDGNHLYRLDYDL